MTEDAKPEGEASQGDDGAPAAGRSYAPVFFKGCGFTLLGVVLAAGVMLASQGDASAFASAGFGFVFLLLILSSSGLTGFWGGKQ